jgi:hypothetical protein
MQLSALVTLGLILLLILGMGVPASSQVVEQAVSSTAVDQPASSPVVEKLKRLDPEEAARGQTDYWARTLRLSPEQATSLQAINLRYATIASTTAKTPGSDSDKLATIATLDAQKDAEVLGTLNAEQSQRYQAIKQQMDQLVKKHIRQLDSVQSAQ